MKEESIDCTVGIVGPFTIDQNFVDGTPIPPSAGGVPVFSGNAFANLGVHVTIHAPYHLDDEELLLESVHNAFIEEVFQLPATSTLLFENHTNTLNTDFREQKAVFGNGIIYPADLNSSIDDCDMLLIAPLTNQDIPSNTLEYFTRKAKLEEQFIALAAQGLIRKVDKEVNHQYWDFSPALLSGTDLVTMDATESYYLCGVKDTTLQDYVDSEKLIMRSISTMIHSGVKEVAITRGSKGSIVGNKEKTYVVPSHPLYNPKGMIGAGDMFTAAYMTRKLSTDNPEDCADYAGKYVADHFNGKYS